MNYKWIGVDKVLKILRRLSAPELTSEIEKTTRKAVLYVHGRVPPYPAPPMGSTYKRTGTLGKGINTDVKVMGSDVVGTIGSPTAYAPMVISDEEVPGKGGPQAPVHKGRWYTLQGVVRKAQDAVNKFFEDMVERLTR